VVQTIGFKTLYVLFFIRHGRRDLVHVNVTPSPSAAWIWRQLLEATPWGRQPAHLIHDRDAVYGRDIDARLAGLGITGVRTPFRSPRANAVGERVVRTFRAECLDHLIVINERHLRAVLREFVRYYNHERPHRTLALETPVPRFVMTAGTVVSRPILGGAPPRLCPSGVNSDTILPPYSYYNHERPHRSLGHQSPVPREVVRNGPIVSRPILGGLHHAYARAA
jgi:transposase InsO family protein